MQRRYYAIQSPRGFKNEVVVNIFTSRGQRDRWVALHADDGDVCSAYLGAVPCTASDAHAILRWRGNEITDVCNRAQEHPADCDCGCVDSD